MEMGGALSIGRFAVSRWRVSMGIECGSRPAGIWQGEPWQHGWEVETGPAMVMDVGAGDFEHKGVATSDGLVSMGLRVAFCLDISGVQEESSRPVEARVV